MKNAIRLLPALLLIALYTNAQTNVSGGIFSNTTWTLANSPYIVVDTVVVFPGVTLTIEPGVVVKFDNNKRLEIRQATLFSNGTVTDSIMFTSNTGSSPGIWSSVYVNGGLSEFNYCNFKYASYGLNGADTVRNSNFVFNQIGCYGHYIDSCNFINNTAIGVGAKYIYHSNILHNQTGVYNPLYVQNCTVDSNQTGIFMYGPSYIYNCSISHNQIGVDASNMGFGYLKNCIINYNTNQGIYFDSPGTDSVISCEIKYNGIGIEDYSCPSGMDTGGITLCIIENNTVGLLISTCDQFYCNSICNNTSYDLKYTGTYNTNNVRNNYWCTPDSASTETVIYDGHDNVSYGLVSFMPIDSLCYLSTGITDNAAQTSLFYIYPNPVHSTFTLSLNNPLSTVNCQLSIYDLTGREVHRQILNPNSSTVTIDVHDLSAGIYFLEVAGEKGRGGSAERCRSMVKVVKY